MYEGEIIESEVASSQPMQIDMCKKRSGLYYRTLGRWKQKCHLVYDYRENDAIRRVLT